ncbi:MAG: hypothetical protein J6U54_05340 [Clostridiales bacterium]|nr:hypothetical protein [Clostridiales bacterium]
MPKCYMCGENFRLQDAIDIFESEYPECSYEDEYPEHDVCGECAINDMENMSAGLDYEYSLETGKAPEDRRWP